MALSDSGGSSEPIASISVTWHWVQLVRVSWGKVPACRAPSRNPSPWQAMHSAAEF